MRIKLTKIAELKDALHPNNIPVGYERIEEVDEKYFIEPTVGKRFWLNRFSTSGVQEILPDNTFKTYSSIYKWQILNR